MNAQEADSVAGIIKINGWVSVATATAAKMGRTI